MAGYDVGLIQNLRATEQAGREKIVGLQGQNQLAVGDQQGNFGLQNIAAAGENQLAVGKQAGQFGLTHQGLVNQGGLNTALVGAGGAPYITGGGSKTPDPYAAVTTGSSLLPRATGLTTSLTQTPSLSTSMDSDPLITAKLPPAGSVHMDTISGYANAGLISGTPNPAVADDTMIAAKKGEYVVPQEVVSALHPQFFDSIVTTVRKKLGLPTALGPKGLNQPDAEGRMNAPGMMGMADGGVLDNISNSPLVQGTKGLVQSLAVGAALPVAIANDAGARTLNAGNYLLGGDPNYFNGNMTTGMLRRNAEVAPSTPAASTPAMLPSHGLGVQLFKAAPAQEDDAEDDTPAPKAAGLPMVTAKPGDPDYIQQGLERMAAVHDLQVSAAARLQNAHASYFENQPTKLDMKKEGDETKIALAGQKALETYLAAHPGDDAGAFAAGTLGRNLAAGVPLVAAGLPGIAGKKHWYGDEAPVDPMPAIFGQKGQTIDPAVLAEFQKALRDPSVIADPVKQRAIRQRMAASLTGAP